MDPEQRSLKAGRRWLDEVTSGASAVPKHLYHYTSGEGLHGILRSSALWGSNFAFMNDRSEFQYAIRVARARLTEASRLKPDPGWLRSFDVAQKLLDAPKNDAYLTCFCEDADLLSQWRGYGSQDSRYCIEFLADQLIPQAGVWPPQAVLYDRNAQNRLLDRLIELHMELVGSLDRGSDHDLARVGANIAIVALPTLARFKDLAFNEEREWRCVSIHTLPYSDDEIEFTISSGMMRPYRVLMKSADKLPITRVIAGASRSDTQAVKSARLMLNKFGYRNVKVVTSRVPLNS